MLPQPNLRTDRQVTRDARRAPLAPPDRLARRSQHLEQQQADVRYSLTNRDDRIPGPYDAP